MILGTARFINNIVFGDLPRIVMHNVPIAYKESVVYLGFTISRTLSWNNQVTKTCAKVNAARYQLKLCGHLFPQPLRARLVAALIFPVFDYYCTVLTDITSEHNLRLQRACNAYVRYVFRVKRDEHITPFFDRLDWLKIKAKRKYFVGCLIFNILLSERAIDLFSVFKTRGNVSACNTRAPQDYLALPLCRTVLFKKSFRCVAAELWNGIPLEIRSATNQKDFKTKFFNHLRRSIT
ncbi:uncharacterized protein LOC115235230 [Formica exsecta]|uniref:uncharacterized protein LOC115235230 n=1 Tax=Formica exsecta TaxID=72781 RepID=UPI001141A377|nr:uncharacterized protein LOC115235230 [Formica exsecta]